MNRRERRAAQQRPGAAAPGLPSSLRDVLAEAVRLHQAGNLGEAERLYRQVLATQPNQADSLHHLGLIAYQRRQLELAVERIRKAIEVSPNNPAAHNSLANALRDQGRLDEAIAACRRALELRPAYPEAYSSLGNALMDRGQTDDAVLCYRKAVELKPEFPEALSNLGHALKQQGRLEESVAFLRKALVLRPDLAVIHNNLGNTLKDQGRLDDAIACYRKATALQPDYWEAHSNLIMTLHYSERQFDEGLPAAIRGYVELMERVPQRRDFVNARDPDRRLRIGYVSGDLRAHPVGYFLSAVLPAHDPAAVETFCYSNAAISDGITAGLQKAAHQWRMIAGRSAAEVDAMIRQDQIDVLVDLAGHTANNRLAVFAARAAPVQATWAGYFGTTGLQAMDYILADRFVIPPGEDGQFSETVWRLPDSYFCFAPPEVDVPIVERPAGEQGGGALVLGSFNNWTKVSDGTVALWSRVLAAIPGSRLLLKTKFLDNPEVSGDAVARFARHGIAAERLILEGPASRDALLAAYNRMDIALDPFPFGGGVTTLEALWMGVPVVAQRGDRWVARVGESIVATVGLPDLVADDADGYVRLVQRLAADRPYLADLRRSLRARLEASPLCDGPRFARSLEAAYRTMWRKWCAQKAS